MRVRWKHRVKPIKETDIWKRNKGQVEYEEPINTKEKRERWNNKEVTTGRYNNGFNNEDNMDPETL